MVAPDSPVGNGRPNRHDDPMDLVGAADLLYGLVPAEFVSQRQELASRARAGGDTELALEIAKLRKPTAGAWLCNLLARQEASQLEQLVELGNLLRDAQDTLDGAQIRELGRQRGQLVAALAALARRHAAEFGHPVGEAAVREVESTLTAALADPGAAELVLAGALTTSLEYVGGGFGGPADGQPVRPRRGPVQRPTPVNRPTESRAVGLHVVAAAPEDSVAAAAEDLDRAERALASARLRAAEAEHRQRDAREQKGRDEAVAAAAAALEVTLARELVELGRRQEAAHEENRHARTRLDATVRAARAADRGHDLAQAQLADAEAALKALGQL